MVNGKRGHSQFSLARPLRRGHHPPVPRTARTTPSGYSDRGNARRPVFHQDGDYAAFLGLLREA